jgi:two-component system probable response regulator PhcQ
MAMSSPKKILYVDDEAMALKYFDRLVSPFAPVLTALSVEEGKAVLREHASEIAVLVSDQRMPGAMGNELLRYAREHHPHIVRMLTTAYSELGEAIEAINTGEIYRYINKPWELDSLRTDLKNALELSSLRSERDDLVRDKLIVQQGQLLANRMASLLMLSAAVQTEAHEAALHQFAQSALVCESVEPAVDWQRWEHADLLQAEAQRGVAIASHLRHWLQAWGPVGDGAQALQVLAETLNADPFGDDSVVITDPKGLTALLTAPAGQAVTLAQCAWLAWLLWQKGLARLEPLNGGYRVSLVNASTLPGDWLADAMEQLGQSLN